VERLANHYRYSGARAKAIFYLDKAAHKMQQEYVNEMALNYYSQALGLEERWQWLKGKVEILHILGRREEEYASLQVLALAPATPIFEVAYLRGQYHEAISEYPQAQAAIEQALSACQSQGETVNEAYCLAQLGLIANRQGDYERAKDNYNQTLTIFHGRQPNSDEEAQVLARSLNGLGTAHRQLGEFDQAKLCYERALSLTHQSGDRQREAEAFNHLGVTAYYQRHFDEARRYYQQALSIRQRIGDRVGEGTSLTNLAQVTRDAGDYGQAQQYLTAALAIVQATGDRWQEVNIWNDLGIIFQELGDLSTARTTLQQGLQVAQQIGDEEGQAYIESNLGLVLRDQGDLAMAAQVLKHGLSLHQRENNKYQMSVFLNYLSTVSLRAGHLEQAIEQAQAALMLHQKLEMRLSTADDLATLAQAHLLANDLAQAVAYARQAIAILDECKGQGPEFPHYDYFIGYQVFALAGEEAAAQAALQAAYNLVIARAEKITDPALRQSFLEQVVVNREILIVYTLLKK
jgi:tetratricopeptide (TPR) repeat protein